MKEYPTTIMSVNSEDPRDIIRNKVTNGVRVAMESTIIHVIEEDLCTPVQMRRPTANKADRSRLVWSQICSPKYGDSSDLVS